MVSEAIQLPPQEIHSEDDVWTALYTYGVKDSLKGILKYYGHEAETKDEIMKKIEKEEEKKTKLVEHSPKAPQRNLRKQKIEELFGSFTDEQAEEALMYFVERGDEKGLILFFHSLDKTIQKKVFDKMMFEAFTNDTPNEEILSLRGRLAELNIGSNFDLKRAVASEDIKKTVLYLKNNRFAISRFINMAPEDVINSVLFEVLKYIPNRT